jgi:hypothetical protein
MISVAVFAAILFTGMAAFQLILALGAQVGAHVLGGLRPTPPGPASQWTNRFGNWAMIPSLSMSAIDRISA